MLCMCTSSCVCANDVKIVYSRDAILRNHLQLLASVKGGDTRECELQSVLILLLIGKESGTFLLTNR